MMRSSLLAILAVASLTVLMGAKEGGCGQGLDNRPGDPGIDVGGATGATWAVSYSKNVKVIVKDAGGIVATHDVVVGAGASFDVGGVTINLDQYCARPDVVCPYDVFPAQVRMTQPGSDLHLLYVQYKPKGPLAGLGSVTLLGNVDSDDDFSIALGIGAAGSGQCGLLAISYATGHIDGNGATTPRGVSLDGEIVTGYAGGCVVAGAGGAAAAGLTVELRIPFSAVRL